MHRQVVTRVLLLRDCWAAPQFYIHFSQDLSAHYTPYITHYILTTKGGALHRYKYSGRAVALVQITVEMAQAVAWGTQYNEPQAQQRLASGRTTR